MSDLLAQMEASSRRRCEAHRLQQPLEALEAEALATPAPPRWTSHGFDLITEIKLSSPSEGALARLDEDQIAHRARAYADAGATAVSILTEPDRFGGRLSHLSRGAKGLSIPVMRKDFLVDPYQVWEARAWGAGGVLLIARMLDDLTMRQMMLATAQAGLFALIEAFDATDLRRIGSALTEAPEATWLVGVNTRDLRTLEVVPDRLARMAEHLPPGAPAVAESGMATPEDVATAARLGYRAALVGTALMRTHDPAPLVRAMRQAGLSP